MPSKKNWGKFSKRSQTTLKQNQATKTPISKADHTSNREKQKMILFQFLFFFYKIHLWPEKNSNDQKN